MRFVTRFLTSMLVFALAAIVCAPAGFAQEVPARPSASVPEVDVPAPDPPDVNASSWVLMAYHSGQIIAARNPDKRVEPASITKIMTDYVVSAEIARGKVSLDDKVYISEHAWRAGGAATDGSTSFLKVHSKVPLKDLLSGMIVQSGNDAAIALAEHVAGSEDAFAQLMNAYAKQLGMTGSHFENASGYPVPNHYMTARDVAIVSRALIHDFPKDYAISAVKKFTWNGITQYNRNALLWRDPSVDGIKTGHTKEAGYCLAASAQRGDERMIAIVMGTPSDDARADAAMALINYGFRFYETHELYAAGKALTQPTLWKGKQDTLPLGVAEDVVITVPRGQYDELHASMNLPATLVAPFQKGERVGTLEITLDGETVLERPLVSLVDAPEGGLVSRLIDSAMLMFKGDDSATAAASSAESG